MARFCVSERILRKRRFPGLLGSKNDDLSRLLTNPLAELIYSEISINSFVVAFVSTEFSKVRRNKNILHF